jgi:transposase
MTKKKKKRESATSATTPCRKTKKMDVVEIAKKKRHLALMEKVQRGAALTATELRDLRAFEGNADLSAGQVGSIEEIAKAFNVSLRTVQRWISQGMPQGDDGEFDLLEIQSWRYSRESTLTDKDREWETAYRKYKALLAEIEYRKRIGELLPRQEVEENMSRAFLKIRMQFQALPRRIVPQLEGLEINEREALLTDRIEEICHELGQDLAADDATWNRFNEFLNQEVQRNGDQGKTEVAGECPRGMEDPAEGKQEKQESPEEEGQGG